MYGIKGDGLDYWIWFITPIPFYGIFALIIAKYLFELNKKQTARGYKFAEYEFQWNTKTLSKFPITAFVTGMSIIMIIDSRLQIFD